MIRALLLVVMILLAVPVAASAQKDKMQLGEALVARVTRGSGAAAPTAVTAPVPRDQLSTTERLSPEKKGAR